MAKHVWVNTERLQEKKMQVEGVDIVVQLSRIDAPRALSGDYVKRDGKFVITFSYVQEEPSVLVKTEDNGIAFREGKYSGKILSISVPVKDNAVAVISLTTKIKDALAERRKRFSGMRTISKELNQNIAEEIFEDESVMERLSEDMVGAK